MICHNVPNFTTAAIAYVYGKPCTVEAEFERGYWTIRGAVEGQCFTTHTPVDNLDLAVNAWERYAEAAVRRG